MLTGGTTTTTAAASSELSPSIAGKFHDSQEPFQALPQRPFYCGSSLVLFAGCAPVLCRNAGDIRGHSSIESDRDAESNFDLNRTGRGTRRRSITSELRGVQNGDIAVADQ